MLGKDLRFKKQAAPVPVAPPVYGQPTMDVEGGKVPTGPAYKVQGPQTPAQVRSAAEASQLVAAAPLSPEQTATTKANAEAAGTLASMQATLKNLKTLFPDASPEQMKTWQTELAQGMTGGKSVAEKYFSQPMTTKDSDGKEHYWRVPMDPNLQPEEIDFNGQTVVPKNTQKPSSAMEAQAIRARYGMDLEKLSPEKASEAIAWYRQQNTPETTSTGQTLVYDQNNQPHVFTHTGTSHKNFPGAKGAPSAPPPSPSVTTPPNGSSTPKTTEDIKKEAAKLNPRASSGSAPNTSRSPIGPALDFKKMTPEVAAANKKYNDAVALEDFADKVQKHPNNAQEQRDFAIMMERTMSGRFQTAAYDLEVKNSGIAQTFQQWMNDISTGALPQKIVDNLVQSAHDYKNAVAKEVEEAKGTTSNAGGASGSDIPPRPKPTKPGPSGAGMVYHRGDKKWHWSMTGNDDLGQVE
jgi:hypothetical protein